MAPGPVTISGRAETRPSEILEKETRRCGSVFLVVLVLGLPHALTPGVVMAIGVYALVFGVLVSLGAFTLRRVISKKLDRVLTDVGGVVRDVRGRIDPLVTTVQGTAVAAQTTMADAQKTMAEMRSAIAQLTPPVGAAIADYQALAQDGRKLVARLDAQVDTLSTSLQTALADAHGVLGDDSPVRYVLANALQERTKVARSLRALADDLDRHPEALLMGKRPETAR